MENINMQRSSGFHLENSYELDDQEVMHYTFDTTTNEYPTTNVQRIPKNNQSNWTLQLLQEQQAQQMQQQVQQQQTRLEMQQDYASFTKELFKDPEFHYGTNRNLMRSLTEMQAPDDSYLWTSFPTPHTTPC
jgi:hypothetical protein